MKLRRIKSRMATALRGPEYAARRAGVTIGSDCRILSEISTTEPWMVTIGDRVTITGGVVILTHDGTGWLYRDGRGRRFRYAPVVIGSDVFIGQGTILMPGVHVGDRCVVAAGSVVTKSIPAGLIVAGNPARVIDTWDSLMARVAAWPATVDMTGQTYRDRVASVAESTFRLDLAVPENLRNAPKS